MAEATFKGQNYSKLRKHHQQLGVPWSDPEFAADDNAIGPNKIRELPRIEWKRPSDLCKSPRLFVDGASRHDATQGRLGNCWFVAATSVLAGSKPLWEKVIPDWKDQEWPTSDADEADGAPKGGGEYSGVFRFRFWRFGQWTEVCVDDRLPTHNDELLFTHSSQNDEFWGALLEKAYAKLHGSYEVLDGGNLSDALVDFTSGVSEVIDIEDAEKGYRTDNPDKKKALYKTMVAEMEDHALMCCAIKATSSSEMESRTDLGLIRGHAYGITAVKKIVLGGTGLSSLFSDKEKLYLVRLQNPWGAKEWTGPFGDGSGGADYLYSCLSLTRLLSRSQEWSNLSEKEREKLGLTFNDDGEFWMPFDDFLHQFTEMSICRLINTSVFSFSKTWDETQHFGSWASTPGKDRAGGCMNNRDTFLNNPQFRFDITKDEDEVIVQLSQLDRRGQEGQELLVIGFHIMKVEANRKYRMHEIQSTTCTSDYIKTKHIFMKKSLPRGRYVLVPTTFQAGEKSEFLLRMFTDSGDADVTELTKDEPGAHWWKCCAKPPVLLTRVKIKGASSLEKQDTFGKADPYVIVKCEGKKVKCTPVEDNLSPDFDLEAVFYRKDPSKPIKVQIWNQNMVMDSFMGQALVLAPKKEGDRKTREKLDLYGRKSKKTEIVPGNVTVEIESHDDLVAI